MFCSENLTKFKKVILLDCKENLMKSMENKGTLTICLEAMCTAFPIASTSAFVSQLPTEEDGKAIEQSIIR